MCASLRIIAWQRPPGDIIRKEVMNTPHKQKHYSAVHFFRGQDVRINSSHDTPRPLIERFVKLAPEMRGCPFLSIPPSPSLLTLAPYSLTSGVLSVRG